MNYGIRLAFGLVGIVAAALLTIAMVFGFERPPVEGVQHGFRGTGMAVIYNVRGMERVAAANVVPKPEDKADLSGQLSSAAYENVKVLGDVDSGEFLRLMTAITNWVSPEQGCGYCHVSDGFASDALYTKVVARRMIQMVRHINTEWNTHVAATGVTCYTCHRGQPVPANIWFNNPGPLHPGNAPWAGKNMVSTAAGLSSLPYDPFTPFLEDSRDIRVLASTALPSGDMHSIKETEWTYALMMHFATSLGVNCTYCHNTRSFFAWDQSTPQRATAWYGIRMVRNVNNDYLGSLASVFPHYRLGQEGDVAKVNCSTCHQGVYKPLFGASMVADYPELATAGAAEPPKQ